MNLSRLASSIAESPTLKLNALAKSMQAQGIPVIHLGGGEPKNKAPLSAVEAATAYLAAGDVKYTPSAGTPSLRKAAAEYTEKNYGRKAAVENIIISSGAKQTLYNLLFTLLDPGDEVIVPAPFWVSYPEMIRMTGGVPVVVPSSPETHIPRAEDLLGAVTARTKAILLNSPNNPSGALYPAGAGRGNRPLLRAEGNLADRRRHLSQAGLRRSAGAQSRAPTPSAAWRKAA